MEFTFGSGQLFGVRQDVANSTPIRFAALQDVMWDISFDLKELYGQNQYALTAGRGKAKITGKAKFARLNALVFSSLFFGIAQAAGQNLVADAEAQSIPGTPYQITVTNSATFLDDLGVVFTSSLLPLTKVAASPAAGQYSVASGVYTFNSADTTKAVQISYTYTASATGQKITVTNQAMGTTPYFLGAFYGTFQNNQLVLRFNRCTAQKLALGTKLDDFAIPEIDLVAFDDGTGTIGTITLVE